MASDARVCRTRVTSVPFARLRANKTKSSVYKPLLRPCRAHQKRPLTVARSRLRSESEIRELLLRPGPRENRTGNGKSVPTHHGHTHIKWMRSVTRTLCGPRPTGVSFGAKPVFRNWRIGREAKYSQCNYRYLCVEGPRSTPCLFFSILFYTNITLKHNFDQF